MIRGLGIDSVIIKRCNEWSSLPKKRLRKLFSDHEIEYCLNNKKKPAERFAARFATKEAFYKAFCQMKPEHNLPFLYIGKAISVQSITGRAPKLLVDWNILQVKQPLTCWLSITHTQQTATVIVLLEQK